MSIQSQLNDLKRSAFNLGKLQHKNDTDEQLKEIFVRNSGAIARMPQTESGILESYKLMGEMEACSQILSERQAKKNRIKGAADAWQAGRKGKEKERFLYMKNAASPNGQLVTAILEDEDGKTAEELATWCDELEELPEEDFKSLLDGLVEEGFVERDDEERYHLLGICTEDPVLSPEMAERRSDRHYSYDEEERDNARRILYVLRKTNKPMNPQECLDRFPEYPELRTDPRYAHAEPSPSEFDVRWTMKTLAEQGILSKEYSVEDTDYYWFATLGKRG